MFEKALRFIQQKSPNAKQVSSQNLGSDRGPGVKGNLKVFMRPVDPETQQPTGEWETIRDGLNLVVTQAQTLMPLMATPGASANAPLNYIELGNPVSATPPALADTTLQQTTGVRKAVTGTTSQNVVTVETTFLSGEGNGFTYTEAGLFVGPFAGGTMFARKTFAGITKNASFELKFQWSIAFFVSTSGGGDCSGISIIGPATVVSDTTLIASGGENSAAASFDFAVGAKHIEVFLNGVRKVPGLHYVEAGPPLTAPILGTPGNKGVNFNGFSLILNDEVYLRHAVLA